MDALAGVRRGEYALRSLRIGGATQLSAGGAPQIRCSERAGGRRAYTSYDGSRGKDATWVANLMALEGIGNGIQPEQGTDSGQVNPFQRWMGRSRHTYSS